MMKLFLRATLFVCIVALFLGAWSLTGVEARSTSANDQAKQGDVGFNRGSMSNLATTSDPRGTGELTDIAVVSASDIWAVGDGLGTLAEHWNGSQWSIVNSPSPGGSFNNLYGVAAVSTNDVWAVGSSANTGNDESKTLIEHWNGSQWSIVPSPSPGTYRDKLYRVTAVSASDVWAVGYTSGNVATSLTLIEHWNGTQWSIVPSPSPYNDALLRGVAVVSASNIWVVGWSNNNGVPQTLIEQWNGASWNIVSSQNPVSASGTSFGDSLYGVTAVSASDVWQ